MNETARALRKIEASLRAMLEEGVADLDALGIIARQIDCQAEMIELGIVE